MSDIVSALRIVVVQDTVSNVQDGVLPLHFTTIVLSKKLSVVM